MITLLSLSVHHMRSIFEVLAVSHLSVNLLIEMETILLYLSLPYTVYALIHHMLVCVCLCVHAV